ncbi:DNA polymerase III subunit gamma/tau [Berryella wangjianweii]|uniref:DNA-directed DNA polymerase n=1 Tax=Berryella wangjianweii TaxID=2734634 RepID=A0A6M8J2T5_9ACTN|nr:DNA polymerase III subunit gamma/tau [Berryella wangjianweii]QKF07794.1 DNA polymerase III subunit gamma/tau [Berryella wangjianweii]
MAESLYRKYRPQVFADVVGQEHIERTIRNAITQDKLSHAYLFTGPRGTGKTTTARLLAKALLCDCGPTPEPDGTCDDCRLIAQGTHPDVYELDAASRTGVENVRDEIISRVQFAPTRGRYKVYIIDEVHMLSVPAFNALLKTLEEPPAHVVFILCTTDPHKVLETIHSRCQRFDFRRIAPEAMAARMRFICGQEGVEAEDEALDLIARRAEGGLRNALTSLEQIVAFEDGRVTLEGAERLLGSAGGRELSGMMRAVGTRDVATCFRWTASFVEEGSDLAQFVRELTERVRNLYVMALSSNQEHLDVSEAERTQMQAELAWFGPDRLARMMGVLGDLTVELRTAANPRLSFEVALTRMTRPDADLTLESLAERVEALEAGYSSVAHVRPTDAGAPAPASSAAAEAADAASTAGRAAPSAAAAAPALAAVTPAATPVPKAQAAAHSVTATAATPSAAPSAASPTDVSAAADAAAPAAAPVVSAAQDAASSPSLPARYSVAQAAAALPNNVRAGLANPAAFQRLWQATVADVKKQKSAYGVLFLDAHPRYDAERTLVVISYGPESSFAYGAVQKPDVQTALALAFERCATSPIPFVFAQDGGRAAAASAVARGAAPAAASGVADAARTLAGRAQAQVRHAATAAAPATVPAAVSAASSASPAASAGSASSTAQAAPAPAPDDDQVPYDDEACYEPASDPYVPPFDTRSAAPAPSATPATPAERTAPAPASKAPTPASAPAPEPAPSATPASDGPAAPAEPVASSDAAPSASPDITEVERMVQGAFGQGVSFTEYDDPAPLPGDPA